jgi:hypothetical protein
MPSNFASADAIQAHRDMTKRVLWKLDCHILPALALVSTPSVEIYPLPIQISLALARKLHRQKQHWKCKVSFYMLISQEYS